MDSNKFANIYLSVCTILFVAGMLLIDHPAEETIVIETPITITPGEQHLVFEPLEISVGE